MHDGAASGCAAVGDAAGSDGARRRDDTCVQPSQLNSSAFWAHCGNGGACIATVGLARPTGEDARDEPESTAAPGGGDSEGDGTARTVSSARVAQAEVGMAAGAKPCVGVGEGEVELVVDAGAETEALFRLEGGSLRNFPSELHTALSGLFGSCRATPLRLRDPAEPADVLCDLHRSCTLDSASWRWRSLCSHAAVSSATASAWPLACASPSGVSPFTSRNDQSAAACNSASTHSTEPAAAKWSAVRPLLSAKLSCCRAGMRARSSFRMLL